MEWSKYWSDFVTKNKLNDKIQEMNEIDMDKNGVYQIEDICHKIFNDYVVYKNELEVIRQKLLEKIEVFPCVHLQTSRVKELDSLLEKVIKKRHSHLLDKFNKYSTITGDNYKDVLTDLIGIRLIISCKGNWINLHQKIIEEFPYVEDKKMYCKYKLIPHAAIGKNILAEIPKVYYAFGDDISMYEDADVETHMKENGYRSTHYIVSFMGVYIEIQTRTIYDEAWSDCNHNYVYKKDGHSSYAALKEMSEILNLLTNTASALGETMRNVYEETAITVTDGIFQIKSDYDLPIGYIFDNMSNTQQLLEKFKKRIQ